MDTFNYRHWLIYAAGGGYGHQTRAIALARTAVKTQTDCVITILVNGDAAKQLCFEKIDSRISIVPLDTSKSNAEIRADIRHRLCTLKFDLLIVDSFPRGVLGEFGDLLSRFDCPKILVHRDTVPDYINSKNVLDAVDEFDHILIPGESAPLEKRSNATRTNRWLIQDSNELSSPHQSRESLGVKNAWLPLCLIALSGKPTERQTFANLGLRLSKQLKDRAIVRVAGELPENPTNELCAMHTRCWPLMELLPGVDFLIGAGGYNTFHESAATDTELLAIPQKRMYDRQWKRLLPTQTFLNPRQLIDTLKSRVANFDREVPRTPPKYRNGTYEAVKKIRSMFRCTPKFETSET